MNDERMRRWRLVLGSEADPETGTTLSSEDRSVDAALAALYDAVPGESSTQRAAGLGSSAPRVAVSLSSVCSKSGSAFAKCPAFSWVSARLIAASSV